METLHTLLFDPVAETVTEMSLSISGGERQRMEAITDLLQIERWENAVGSRQPFGLWVDEEGLIAPKVNAFSVITGDDGALLVAGRFCITMIEPAPSGYPKLNTPVDPRIADYFKARTHFAGTATQAAVHMAERGLPLPESSFEAGGKKEVFWRWSPDEYEKAFHESNEAK